jgi:hypothetical protein
MSYEKACMWTVVSIVGGIFLLAALICGTVLVNNAMDHEASRVKQEAQYHQVHWIACPDCRKMDKQVVEKAKQIDQLIEKGARRDH